MLAISPLSINCNIERDGGANGSFAGTHAEAPHDHDDFIGNEFLGAGPPVLEDFNFDDLFMDFDDKDVLPDLEVHPAEVDLRDFSFDGGDELRTTTAEATAGELSSTDNGKVEDNCKSLSQENNKEVMSSTSTSKEEGRKSSVAKGSHGKRKMKVDWTPELHRRFVQAVEQLGIDKAVPSRILEIMGIDCLTRHNIASHLQKYRSHRKHLLAREAEAAIWSHRRHMYPTAGGSKRDMNSPWVSFAPTMGFPPHPPPVQHPFRPLHVWGHPTMDMWPKHFVRAPSPPPPWVPPPPPSPWLPHYPRGPNAVTQGTPCFPRPVPPAVRFPPPTVPCISPHPLNRPDSTPARPNNKKLGSHLQLLDALPSKESVDAAIGDVLAKPWLPLPLGLKPPSVESVMGELQKQGISKVPPASS